MHELRKVLECASPLFQSPTIWWRALGRAKGPLSYQPGPKAQVTVQFTAKG